MQRPWISFQPFSPSVTIHETLSHICSGKSPQSEVSDKIAQFCPHWTSQIGVNSHIKHTKPKLTKENYVTIMSYSKDTKGQEGVFLHRFHIKPHLYSISLPTFTGLAQTGLASCIHSCHFSLRGGNVIWTKNTVVINCFPKPKQLGATFLFLHP